MTQDFMLYALKEALLTAAMVAAPLLLAILIVGLLVSILQVATQIQEMTLTFIPKLIVTVARGQQPPCVPTRSSVKVMRWMSA